MARVHLSLFQFQTGAIKKTLGFSIRLCVSGVSIPNWCD